MSFNYLLTKDRYQLFQKYFKEYAKQKTLTCEDMILHAIVHNKPWIKCFSPVTNKKKLKNNCFNYPLWSAFHYWLIMRYNIETCFVSPSFEPKGILKRYPNVFGLLELNSLYVLFQNTSNVEKIVMGEKIK